MDKQKDYETQVEIGIQHLYQNDKEIAKLIEKYPKFNIKPSLNYFEDLVASIIMQQLSMKAGRAIYNKFRAYFNNNITPEKILKSNSEKLRELGISNQKINYLLSLSQNCVEGNIDLSKISQMSDVQIREKLLQVKGIGNWTVDMFLIFTLGHLNVLPFTDLGIRKAIAKIYFSKELVNKQEMLNIQLEKKWSPFSTIASWYLWRSLENE
jgi:DNA-3-methyladenine glycosylase II